MQLSNQKKTAPDGGLTNHVSLTMTLTLTYDPDLQSLPAMVMTYSQAKVQGLRSVGSEDRVKTNNRTDAIALPAALMRSITSQSET